ncbi:uncharacterized protein MONBRDRAFT_6494 [Monosiga brevicollis MX1]|uniref:C2H2-type domain-containing protein n=1 Tax=Monosiga brevicollis TaxID=81824 RepID=A9UU20_MONBE|nr:uncharacterized protein MONBRDRAFT_6494 [Monosiga brevicollis MX1]EDQ91592.1 predicted protein [Monosiga brevicollis MX1]|eukprot:XP_001744014.1 hypothetical protein [Monosiga brevicollis MX1]
MGSGRKDFVSTDVKNHHLRRHQNQIYKCPLCANEYSHASSFKRHVERDHDQTPLDLSSLQQYTHTVTDAPGHSGAPHPMLHTQYQHGDRLNEQQHLVSPTSSIGSGPTIPTSHATAPPQLPLPSDSHRPFQPLQPLHEAFHPQLQLDPQISAASHPSPLAPPTHPFASLMHASQPSLTELVALLLQQSNNAAAGNTIIPRPMATQAVPAAPTYPAGPGLGSEATQTQHQAATPSSSGPTSLPPLHHQLSLDLLVSMLMHGTERLTQPEPTYPY